MASIVFTLSQILNSPATPPPVVLTKLQINGETVPVVAGSMLPRPIWDTTSLKLAHNQNGLSVEFAALSYSNPSKIRYRFRLDGLEKQWTTVDAQQRNARYTDLRPDEYVFRVQASTDGGVNWGEQGASLRARHRAAMVEHSLDQVRCGPGVHRACFSVSTSCASMRSSTASCFWKRWSRGGQRNWLRPAIRLRLPIKERKKRRP